MSAVATAVRISLEIDHEAGACRDLSRPLLLQLARGYEMCSVLPMPASVEDWREEHRTARKRANRAANLGYRFAEIERERYDEDIFQINTSLDVRQGRPMGHGYRERSHFLPLPEYPCTRHAIRTFGVLSGRRLVSYLWLYRSGELALVSSILGHGEYLHHDVMYLLFQGVVESEAEHGGYLVYNRHDSGTDGLRYFKERLGFQPTEVDWCP
jgi:hypothetical protein